MDYKYKTKIDQTCKNLELSEENWKKKGRFLDQKVTPDVLMIVSEVILKYFKNDKTKDKKFTINDLWNSKFAKRIPAFFGKPEIKNKSAKNEYDKFFSQPICTLSFSGILTREVSRKPHIYRIENEPLLKYISLSSRNSNYFLFLYIKKFLKDNNLFKIFENYLEDSTKENFHNLKDVIFYNFIANNTPINTKTEINRIWPKLLNPLAFYYKTNGSKDGRISDQKIQFMDLLYNKPNWRDVGKPKDITRKEYVELEEKEDVSDELYEYELKKILKEIKNYHKYMNEIHPTKEKEMVNGHHIFSKSNYPEFYDLKENIILLTPDQHFSYAHPGGNTQYTSKEYQLICLIYKLDSIERSELLNRDGFYSKDNYVDMIQNVLDGTEIKSSWEYEKIKYWLAHKFIEKNIPVKNNYKVASEKKYDTDKK